MTKKAIHLKAGDKIAGQGRIYAVHNNGEVVLLANGEWREFHINDEVEVETGPIPVPLVKVGDIVSLWPSGGRKVKVMAVASSKGCVYILGRRDDGTRDWEGYLEGQEVELIDGVAR